MPSKAEAWVAAGVQALSQHDGVWVGRLHVHKILVCADLLGLTTVPFEFELYRYGPYSFEIDRTVSQMESFGLLAKDYPVRGYGPKYELTDLSDGLTEQLDDSDIECLDDLARFFAAHRLTSVDLELLSTALWVEIKEKISDDDSIVDRVEELKPHRVRADIRRGLVLSRELQRECGNS